LKIYVAGHAGLVGSAIVRSIEKDSSLMWVGKTRSELDLLNRSAVFDFLADEKPDAVIVAAAKVGGIWANKTQPVEFLTENLQIQNNLLDGSHAVDINRLLFLGSSCIYPALAPQPIKEEYLLTGPLEPTNASYAIAKIAGIQSISSYRQEYGRAWISAMPTNLYGPGDNFDLTNSHVLPAMIRKFHEAKITGLTSLELWGSGTPMREFMHSSDMGEAALFLLKNYDGDSTVNVGSGREISIHDLASLVSKVVGFTGEIKWDNTKPNGTPRKILDTTKIRNLGWVPTVSLEEGISSTYSWFLENSN
jgi:GDP-L-fucose synthase